MKHVYTTDGLCCAHCAAKIEAEISKLEGVDKANVNFLSEKIVLETQLDREALLAQIRDIVDKIEPDCRIS